MRVLFVLLLLQLQLLPVLVAGVNTVSPHCPAECGDVSIPYPFGIGAGCFMPGFELHCNKTVDGLYKPFIYVSEVISISLQSGQAGVYNHISFSCYEDGQRVANNNDGWHVDFTQYPYRFSNTLNKFTTVGCESLAYMISEKGNNSYQSGCLSVCRNQKSISDGRCSGMGCCQTSIPEGLNYYKVQFDERFDNFDSVFNPCSYAFLVEEKKYKFDTSHVTTMKLSKENDARMPLVVDWAIGDVPCDVARANPTTYACLSEHSECLNSTNGPGYLCNCSSGYQGNPYLKNGCQDIDECEDQTGMYPCYGSCVNLQGTYSCACPSGTDGDPYVEGGCRPKFPLWLILALGSLCIFVVMAFTYIVFEKVKFIRIKQKYFRQNGGLLLQEQINAYQGVKFKIFTREQMEMATMNFDMSQVLGEGGHGMVYKGILDDKRIVAIKKSRITDEKQKKEFAKEIYIGSSINHKNVVKILGCCLEVEIPLLVYEFVPKGTLFEYIHNKNLKMPLEFRLKVAVESATALAYLHSDASPSILHGDVKSTNILLDDNLISKVSDFGASLLDKNESKLFVQGTYGYLDPEYLETGLLTEKSDVYSFAVVLLELLTRRIALQSNGSDEDISLVSIFNKNRLVDILDDEVKCEFQVGQLEEFTELLKQCLSPVGENRPIMKEVVAWLERLRKIMGFSRVVKYIPHKRENSVDESSSYHTIEATKYFSFENQNVINVATGR